MWTRSCGQHNWTVRFRNLEKNQKIQKLCFRYHDCIDQVNNNMTNRIIDETDVSASGIYNLLCDGMHDIVVKCSVILADCYGPQDMLDMRNGQLKLTQKVSDFAHGVWKSQKSCIRYNFIKVDFWVILEENRIFDLLLQYSGLWKIQSLLINMHSNVFNHEITFCQLGIIWVWKIESLWHSVWKSPRVSHLNFGISPKKLSY